MYFFSLYVVTCTYFSRMRKRTTYLYIKIEEREVYKIQQLLKVYTTRHGQPCAKLRDMLCGKLNHHQNAHLKRTSSNYLDGCSQLKLSYLISCSSNWSVVEVFLKHLAFLSFRILHKTKANKESSLRRLSDGQLCLNLYHLSCRELREAHLSVLVGMESQAWSR